MNKKWILGLALAVSVSVLSACGEEEAEKSNEEQPTESTEQPELPEPNMDEIPEVVAEVNGEEISKNEFEPIYVNTLQTYAMQGMYSEEEDENGEMEKQIQKQTAEQLVGRVLLLQEANKRKLSVSEEELNEQLTSLKEQFGSEEQYQEALESENLSEEDIIRDFKTEMKIQQLVEEEAGEIEVSEEELKSTYDQLVKAQDSEENEEAESNVPDFEEVKPQLENQMKQQQLFEERQKIIEDLRESGDVTIHI